MKETRIEEKYVLKPWIQKRIEKMLVVMIIFLAGMILTKNQEEKREIIRKEIYESAIPVVNARSFYQKYFSFLKEKAMEPVMKEITDVKKEKKISEDVVQAIESGIVILVEDGKVVLEQVDGVTTTYENIKINPYKIYDYIEKGDVLGRKEGSDVLLSFSKEGKPYNYE